MWGGGCKVAGLFFLWYRRYRQTTEVCHENGVSERDGLAQKSCVEGTSLGVYLLRHIVFDFRSFIFARGDWLALEAGQPGHQFGVCVGDVPLSRYTPNRHPAHHWAVAQ